MEHILEQLLNDPAAISGAGAVLGALGLLVFYFVFRRLSGIEKPDAAKETRPVIEPKKAEPAIIPTGLESLTKEPVAEPIKVKKDLKDALSGTKANIFGRIKQRLTGDALKEDDLESLEEVLYTSDLGPQTVQRLVETVGDSLKSSEKADIDKVQSAIKNEMTRIFENVQTDLDSSSLVSSLSLKNSDEPQVIMVVGVNGAGKTTTIGKLAYQLTESGKKVMLIAGDTFRAAAEKQLEVWSDRAQVEIFSPENVKDPSAVVYEGIAKAKSQNVDVVIVDTAGRLHTQDNLMEELKKMKRVMAKHVETAPHQIFIVLDANSGQNALMQAKHFNEALGLTGAILTKLDGSAKGGVAVGLAYELSLPIRLIGVGEGIEDLRTFQSKDFVDSII